MKQAAHSAAKFFAAGAACVKKGKEENVHALRSHAKRHPDRVHPRQLILFFLPIWFGTLFQQLYNTADTLIVGNFVGTEALAAVGATGAFVQHTGRCVRRPVQRRGAS